MAKSQPGRNDRCPCGSGKKFKDCCLKKVTGTTRSSWDDKVTAAGFLSLESDKEKVEQALSDLEKLLGEPNLTANQRVNGLSTYAQALQRNGRHSDALAVLDKLRDVQSAEKNVKSDLFRALIRASSLSALGSHADACDLIHRQIPHLDTFSNRERGMLLVEIGKIFASAGKIGEAEGLWNQGLKALEGDKAEVEHYARLLANLASLKLKSGNEQSEAEGIEMMDRAMEMKLSVGDLHGLANSYDMLGFHYARSRRYERAIVNFRRGLALSRQVGDTHGLVQALMNLAGLYCELRQVGEVRRVMNEALKLSETLKNQHLIQACQHNQEQINLNAREFSKNGETLGVKAACLCGSGKTYQDCCGRADFEPVTLPWAFGGLSQDAQQTFKELEVAGIKSSRLDLFLRSVTQQQNRYAWFKVNPQDGWHEVLELPDLASIHLRASEDAAARSKQAPGSFEHPLAALILAACALEAFINQVAFFIVEVNRTDKLDISRVPTALLSDCLAFQRSTELTQKWDMLGSAICHAQWPPSVSLWADFKRLVAMRNEFVHFKLADYEQIIPPPKQPNRALGMLPSTVAPREDNHSWAFKVLSPEMAAWASGIAHAMFSEFRAAYAKTRKTK